MSHIKISSPFVKNFIHSSHTVTTSAVKYLDKAEGHIRRVSVIIQNQGATAVTFNSDGSAVGITIAPGFTVSFENYNGAIWLKGITGGEVVHVAYAIS